MEHLLCQKQALALGLYAIETWDMIGFVCLAKTAFHLLQLREIDEWHVFICCICLLPHLVVFSSLHHRVANAVLLQVRTRELANIGSA